MTKDELREKLRIFQYNDHQGIELSEDHLDYIMSLFDSFHTQEVERARLEGGISELSHVDGLPTCFIQRNGMIVHLPIDKRLGELRQQLSTNNKDVENE